METIFEKYAKLRPQIQDGDIILFHGTHLLARIIQNCDNAYYNHVGIVIEKHGALFIVDANGNGVQADRLSWRISKYPSGDFSIIKPLATRKNIDSAMSILLERSDRKWIKYDFFNGGKELFNRKFNWSLKVNTSENRDICSDFVSDYAIALNLVTFAFKKLKISFPEDYVRFLSINNAILIK